MKRWLDVWFILLVSISVYWFKGANPVSLVSNMNDVTEVTPNLYVCSKWAINDEIIQRLGITMIINSAKGLDNYKPASKDLSLIYVNIPVRDQSDAHIYPYFMKTAELIESNKITGGKTIVHCVAGVSRSVSLCAAYLMTNFKSETSIWGKSRMGSEKAVKYIQKIRG